MAGMIPEGARVLEPSAGLGRIVDALERRAKPSKVVAVEIAPQCAGQLYQRFPAVRLIQGDFLECDADRLGGAFGAIVMNPPFKQGRDVEHIRHASMMLEPGGVLVALCYNGVRQNDDLRGWADSWEVLPEGTFKQEGTRASVVLLTKTN